MFLSGRTVQKVIIREHAQKKEEADEHLLPLSCAVPVTSLVPVLSSLILL